MPNIPNSLGYRLGLFNQSAEGTLPTTTANFETPVWAEALAPTEDQQAFEVNDATNLRPGYYVKSAGWGGTVTMGAFRGSAALPWIWLLGTDTPTGAGPYTHTVSTADPNNKWQTLWVSRPTFGGSTLVDKFEDGTVTSVEVVHEFGQPLKQVVEFVGKTVTTAGAFPTTITNPETYSTGGVFLSAIGATLKMDVASTPASTTVTNIISASVKVMRATTLEQTGELTPRYRSQGLYTVAVSATVELDSTTAQNYYRATFFGGVAGTVLSPVVVSGSLDFKWVEAPTVTGTNYLQLQVPAVVYEMMPQHFDASGAPTHLTVTAMLDKPAAGAAITPIIGNTLATYP